MTTPTGIRRPRTRTTTTARIRTALLAAILAASAVVVGTGPVAADSGGALAGRPRGDAASLSAGDAHTCGKVADGKISCWGSDEFGQIGDGGGNEDEDKPTPVASNLPRGRAAKQIAVGGVNGCVVLDNNGLTCWGDDRSGQIGDSREDRNIFAADNVVSTPEPIVAVSVGFRFACGLFKSANVRCWGSDSDGQLGNGGAASDGVGGDNDVDTVRNARELEFPNGRTAAAVSAGQSHACAVLDNSQISCWGDNESGQLGNGSSADAITSPTGLLALPSGRSAEGVSAGRDHTCALLDNGDVTCWGSDASGQLGNGSAGSRTTPPGRIGLPGPAIAVAAGGSHTCAVLQSGDLYCWGANGSGQLGDGTRAGSQTPVKIELGDGKDVAAVALGLAHTCALASDRTVRCWGENEQGQVGNGAKPTDQLVPSAPVTSVEPGEGEGDDGGTVVIAENDAAPSRPIDVIASGGRGTVELDWDAPLDNGGSAITGYRIQQSVDNGTTWTTIVESTRDDDTDADVSDVTPTDAARFRVAAINAIGVSPYSEASSATLVTPERDLVTIDPIRLHDSRGAGETIDGQSEKDGSLAPRRVRRIQIAGRGDVPADAPAAVLNTTIVQAADRGFATVYPCTDEAPLASTVNYLAGRNVANVIVAQLDADGGVCIETSSQAQVIFDATGYVPFGSLIEPIEPTRHLDTRASGNTIDNQEQRRGPVSGGSFITIPIAGRPGVPENATSALLNVTAVQASAAGFATVYPCGDRPTASSLNFQQGVNVANAVVAKLSEDGEVCIFAERTANFLIDVTGFSVSSTLTPIEPRRFLDTRRNGQTTFDGAAQGRGRVGPDDFVKVQIAGRGIVPADATAAAISVVAVDPRDRGFLTTFPCGSRPLASTLNYEAGQNVPNLALTALDDDGAVCVYVNQAAHVLIDVTAYQ